MLFLRLRGSWGLSSVGPLPPSRRSLPDRVPPHNGAPELSCRATVGLRGSVVMPLHTPGIAPPSWSPRRPSHEQSPSLPRHQGFGVLEPWNRRQVSGRPAVTR